MFSSEVCTYLKCIITRTVKLHAPPLALRIGSRQRADSGVRRVDSGVRRVDSLAQRVDIGAQRVDLGAQRVDGHRPLNEGVIDPSTRGSLTPHAPRRGHPVRAGGQTPPAPPCRIRAANPAAPRGDAADVAAYVAPRGQAGGGQQVRDDAEGEAPE
eukprot:8563403-Pyramimonas_sp.AAC.1